MVRWKLTWTLSPKFTLIYIFSFCESLFIHDWVGKWRIVVIKYYLKYSSCDLILTTMCLICNIYTLLFDIYISIELIDVNLNICCILNLELTIFILLCRTPSGGWWILCHLWVCNVRTGQTADPAIDRGESNITCKWHQIPGLSCPEVLLT